MSTGRVVLVGAGPGSPDLITLRGAAALGRAEVVVYDSLSCPELLELAPASAEHIDVGKRGHDAPTRGQDEINALLVRLARAGRYVVRLKGGDPFVFGRGGEEVSACRAAGVPVEVIPGVSSAVAAAAAAGIPVTDRRHAASVAVVTGHRDASRPWTGIRWDRLATGADTLVILMGMRNLEKITATLIDAGRSPETPAAVVMEAETPRQRVVRGPLHDIARRSREAGLGAPAVVVVGDVVTLSNESTGRGLAGRRVLVTRPASADDPLVAALVAAGAEPVCVPTVRVEAVAADPEPDDARRVAGCDDLLFTSRNAVRFLRERLARSGIDPATLDARVWCVGEATAEAARTSGFPRPRVPHARYQAAALLDAIRAEGPLRGRRFLFARGLRAGNTLPAGLREDGAIVDEWVLYRTVPENFDAPALAARLVRGELDALTFTSPSAVKAFAAGLGAEALEAARRSTVAAIGSVTAEALRAVGLVAHAVPERAGMGALVEALERLSRAAEEEGR